MKLLRCLLLAVLLIRLVPAAAQPPASFGTHGMVVFGGRDALYASHLGMFHSPHDTQLVLRFHLANPRQDRALRARLGGKPALWTLAPEKFALARLAPAAALPLHHFQADLVQGHFEQGGTIKFPRATITVDEVLLYRPLVGRPQAHDHAQYMQIGTGSKRYLVKLIDSRPDFDHIIAVRAAPGTPTAVVKLPKIALTQPGDDALSRALPGAQVDGTVYFSTDDLK
jgi:hypothetical protein